MNSARITDKYPSSWCLYSRTGDSGGSSHGQSQVLLVQSSGQRGVPRPGVRLNQWADRWRLGQKVHRPPTHKRKSLPGHSYPRCGKLFFILFLLQSHRFWSLVMSFVWCIQPTVRYIYNHSKVIQGNVCGILLQAENCTLSHPDKLEWAITPSNRSKPVLPPSILPPV